MKENEIALIIILLTGANKVLSRWNINPILLDRVSDGVQFTIPGQGNSKTCRSQLQCVIFLDGILAGTELLVDNVAKVMEVSETYNKRRNFN